MNVIYFYFSITVSRCYCCVILLAFIRLYFRDIILFNITFLNTSAPSIFPKILF